LRWDEAVQRCPYRDGATNYGATHTTNYGATHTTDYRATHTTDYRAANNQATNNQATYNGATMDRTDQTAKGSKQEGSLLRTICTTSRPTESELSDIGKQARSKL